MEVLVFYVILIVALLGYLQHKKTKIKNQIYGLSNNTLEMTPEEFLN